MRITIEHYGKIYTTQWKAEGQNAAEIIQTFCAMMILTGWSEETINNLFKEADGSPLQWEMQS